MSANTSSSRIKRRMAYIARADDESGIGPAHRLPVFPCVALVIDVRHETPQGGRLHGREPAAGATPRDPWVTSANSGH